MVGRVVAQLPQEVVTDLAVYPDSAQNMVAMSEIQVLEHEGQVGRRHVAIEDIGLNRVGLVRCWQRVKASVGRAPVRLIAASATSVPWSGNIA
jgi:hypothetical protein